MLKRHFRFQNIRKGPTKMELRVWIEPQDQTTGRIQQIALSMLILSTEQ